jgi:glyceraldehyde-3-phosphate dehydrogenase (NAD(P))
MAAKKVVHIIGTGTIGEPLIGLFLNLREQLEIDEITFHKNRPLLGDRAKVKNLIRRGAKLVVAAEKMSDLKNSVCSPPTRSSRSWNRPL